MSIWDWSIVVVLMTVLVTAAFVTKRFSRSVADFLAANRCAERYLLAVATGISAVGAITFIACFEGVYVGGLTNTWWTMGEGFIVAVVMVSGWIMYRFRQTRALTLAQFLEMRYSKKFRLFSGIICWISGIINFGIFPSVGARFFMAVLHIPFDAVFAGIPVYALLLFVLIATAYLFTMLGGQVSVMVTDYIQGTFCNISMLLIVIASLCIIGLPAINRTLLDSISASNKQVLTQAIDHVMAGGDITAFDFKESPKAAVLTAAVKHSVQPSVSREEALESALTYYKNNDSMIHPFKISGKKDLNILFYVMTFWLNFYSGRIWQGTQGYNAAALTPHESRMGNILGMLRGIPTTVFVIIMPICALAYFNSDAFLNSTGELKFYLSQLSNPNIQRQMATPLAMMEFLPVGLKGCFVALMLAAFISTHDTYMHSWGSIFIQDVVMPFRKKPLPQALHIKLLKLSILFVCVFIFVFSMIFQQTEYIVMFWNITGAIFTGGAGAVVIGGLYWKRGTTGAAWAAMITGSLLAVGGVVIGQINGAMPFKNPLLVYIASKNGVELAFGSGLIAMAVYAAVSLLSRREAFNMDRLLHRGVYAVASDEHDEESKPVRGIRALIGLNKEFSKSDRRLYYFCVVWMLSWAVIFAIGTVYGSIVKTTDEGWLMYWKVYFTLFTVLSVVITVWFAVMGNKNLIAMFKRLAKASLDESDDGVV